MGVLLGELAAAAGVSPSAVRYYEAQGLLPRPERRSGRRVYDREDLRRLQLLAFARRVGFNIAELKRLAAAFPGSAPEVLDEAVRGRLSQVDDMIRELQSTREQLVLAEACECTSDGAPPCSLIIARL